jgi:hypothetical protein
MPVIMNKKTTPGPPLKTAPPRLLKLPAPIIAAMPKKVRSLTFSTLFRPEPWVSPPKDCASLTILSMDFFLKKELNIIVGFWYN